jgi:arylsulfate sulfotransferase
MLKETHGGFLIAVLLLLAAGTNLEAAISITLTPSPSSPAPLGTLIHWSTAVTDTGSGTLWYRFRSAEPSAKSHETFHMIVDYGPNNSLDWTEIDHEATYQVEVSVEDMTSGETATAVVPFAMTTRLKNADTPVISSTDNPIVFLYSAPGCEEGGNMLVQFKSPEGTVTTTPYQACHDRGSMNFYLAGMRARTRYQVQHTLNSGSTVKLGPILTLTTGSITITPPAYTVYAPLTDAAQNGLLVQCGITTPVLVASDLAGNVVWYYGGPIYFATRAEPGGFFLGIWEDPMADASGEYVVKFDLAGTTLLETNAGRVNQQLAAMGIGPIDAFHHEVREISGGRYLVLADNERILTNVQGPGPVDVIGDEILVLDSNFQVVWAWDAFDHLDTSRMAVLGETCPSGAGCAPYHLAATANDWLHGNSLAFTPDGQILYSSRHQDWVFKINYNYGNGDGSVIWRLGLGGDFQIVSSDPYPWFSHQHDAGLEQSDAGTPALPPTPPKTAAGKFWNWMNRIASQSWF